MKNQDTPRPTKPEKGQGREQMTPVMERVFDPEKVGLIHCPLCNGEAKLPKEKDGFKVCPECEGFGMIKKKETAEEKTVEFRGVRIALPK